MTGAKTFICMGCGETFSWAPEYGAHTKSCTESFKVEFIKIYGEVVVSENGCWIWGRKLNKPKNGYPSSTKFGYMHRAMYIAHTGDTDIADLDICHKCDNPPCVNPEHLFKGTRKDNMQDQSSKNRHWLKNVTSKERELWLNKAIQGRKEQARKLRENKMEVMPND